MEADDKHVYEKNALNVKFKSSFFGNRERDGRDERDYVIYTWFVIVS